MIEVKEQQLRELADQNKQSLSSLFTQVQHQYLSALSDTLTPPDSFPYNSDSLFDYDQSFLS